MLWKYLKHVSWKWDCDLHSRLMLITACINIIKRKRNPIVRLQLKYFNWRAAMHYVKVLVSLCYHVRLIIVLNMRVTGSIILENLNPKRISPIFRQTACFSWSQIVVCLLILLLQDLREMRYSARGINCPIHLPISTIHQLNSNLMQFQPFSLR